MDHDDHDARTVETLRAAMQTQVRDCHLPPEIAAHARRRLAPARRRSRRHLVAVVTVAACVVAIAAVVSYVGATGGGTHHQHTGGPASAHNPNTTSAPPSAVASAPGPSIGQLAGYRWTRLPTAPITGRVNPAAVWTGTEMIVWGGEAENGPLYADGAAYDPAARRWSLLPPSPLSAREGSATVLAGNSMFIWGGVVGADLQGRARDGALYDPAKRHWSLLPTAPVGPYQWAQALWSGGRVILLTTPPGRDVTVVHAAAFDPSTGEWATLPDLDLPAKHPVISTTAMSAQDRVYIWPHWFRSVQIRPHTFELFSGIDGFTLDTSADRWTRNKIVPDQQHFIGQPLWTGHNLLLPASSYYCGGCAGGPPDFNLHGYLVDPDTGAATALPHGPVDDLHPQYVWTGRALLGYDTSGSTSGGPSGRHGPGETAAWNPTINRWSTLHTAPLAGAYTVAVWTGTSLIEWGTMYRPATTAAAKRRHITAGLEFGPP